MSFDLYEQLGAYFHREGRSMASFCNAFSWNLMARHFNVQGLTAGAFGWTGDAMTVEYGKDKVRQEGGGTNKAGMLKHIYANPFQPEVGPPHPPHSATSATFRHIHHRYVLFSTLAC